MSSSVPATLALVRSLARANELVGLHVTDKSVDAFQTDKIRFIGMPKGGETSMFSASTRLFVWARERKTDAFCFAGIYENVRAISDDVPRRYEASLLYDGVERPAGGVLEMWEPIEPRVTEDSAGRAFKVSTYEAMGFECNRGPDLSRGINRIRVPAESTEES